MMKLRNTWGLSSQMESIFKLRNNTLFHLKAMFNLNNDICLNSAFNVN